MSSSSNNNNNNRSSDQKQSNKLSHYMKVPFRALVRARDMYVRGLGGCAGRVERGRVISSAAAAARSSHGFYQSRNASVRNDDDINDLISAASQGLLGTLNLKDMTVVSRSQSVVVGVGSVGIRRIDEDEPCNFGEPPTQEVAYPQSQSCAVGIGFMEKRRRVGAVAA